MIEKQQCGGNMKQLHNDRRGRAKTGITKQRNDELITEVATVVKLMPLPQTDGNIKKNGTVGEVSKCRVSPASTAVYTWLIIGGESNSQEVILHEIYIPTITGYELMRVPFF